MLPATVMLMLFLLGIALTFGGVLVLGSGKALTPEVHANIDALTDLSSALASNDSAALEGDVSVRPSAASTASVSKREDPTVLKCACFCWH